MRAVGHARGPHLQGARNGEPQADGRPLARIAAHAAQIRLEAARKGRDGAGSWSWELELGAGRKSHAAREGMRGME